MFSSKFFFGFVNLFSHCILYFFDNLNQLHCDLSTHKDYFFYSFLQCLKKETRKKLDVSEVKDFVGTIPILIAVRHQSSMKQLTRIKAHFQHNKQWFGMYSTVNIQAIIAFLVPNWKVKLTTSIIDRNITLVS